MAPTFAITGANISWTNVSKNAEPGTRVWFPTMTASDASGTPLISCTGNTGSGVTTVTFPAGTPGSAIFTMQVNSHLFTMACSAKDAAGNTSPSQVFTVRLKCKAKWSSKSNKCVAPGEDGDDEDDR